MGTILPQKRILVVPANRFRRTREEIVAVSFQANEDSIGLDVSLYELCFAGSIGRLCRKRKTLLKKEMAGRVIFPEETFEMSTRGFFLISLRKLKFFYTPKPILQHWPLPTKKFQFAVLGWGVP